MFCVMTLITRVADIGDRWTSLSRQVAVSEGGAGIFLNLLACLIGSGLVEPGECTRW